MIVFTSGKEMCTMQIAPYGMACPWSARGWQNSLVAYMPQTGIPEIGLPN